VRTLLQHPRVGQGDGDLVGHPAGLNPLVIVGGSHTAVTQRHDADQLVLIAEREDAE
jgi:hypothetical protein